jgi:hypothetical protein
MRSQSVLWRGSLSVTPYALHHLILNAQQIKLYVKLGEQWRLLFEQPSPTRRRDDLRFIRSALVELLAHQQSSSFLLRSSEMLDHKLQQQIDASMNQIRLMEADIYYSAL